MAVSAHNSRSPAGSKAILASVDARRNGGSEAAQGLTDVETSSSDELRHTGSPQALEVADLEPFAVAIYRRDDVAVVQPRGELDIATVDTLDAALARIESASRVVLDLQALSFIGSTGLHLLVALHERAQRDGFQLMLLAPPAPVDRAIRLSGLDEVLPFVTAVDVVDAERGESASRP